MQKAAKRQHYVKEMLMGDKKDETPPRPESGSESSSDEMMTPEIESREQRRVRMYAEMFRK